MSEIDLFPEKLLPHELQEGLINTPEHQKLISKGKTNAD